MTTGPSDVTVERLGETGSLVWLHLPGNKRGLTFSFHVLNVVIIFVELKVTTELNFITNVARIFLGFS